MKSFSASKRRAWLLVLCLLPLTCGLRPAGFAAGFTEPPVTFYGTISQTADGYTVPVTAGTLNWTITPPAGTSVKVNLDLASTATTGFYRLKVPVEKVPPKTLVSTNTINAPAALTTFTRGTVTLNGSTALSIIYPTGTSAGAFSFNEASRGKIDRVDLTFTGAFTDSDGDGLPDWFEDKYGLDKYNPYDSVGLDSHGRTLLYDYQHHIDPVLGTEYEQWASAKIPANVSNNPTADPDGDGLSNLVEFALDTNPNTADSTLARQRMSQSTTVVNGKRYLTMTLTLPATPRVSVNYVVESSSDLVNWGSTEGTDVVTISSTASQRQVRAARSMDDANGARVFLRLRATLNQ